jgi:hypothetical protein
LCGTCRIVGWSCLGPRRGETHERPNGRPGGTGALGQQRAGAIVRGMGSVCGWGGGAIAHLGSVPFDSSLGATNTRPSHEASTFRSFSATS